MMWFLLVEMFKAGSVQFIMNETDGKIQMNLGAEYLLYVVFQVRNRTNVPTVRSASPTLGPTVPTSAARNVSV